MVHPTSFAILRDIALGVSRYHDHATVGATSYSITYCVLEAEVVPNIKSQ